MHTTAASMHSYVYIASGTNTIQQSRRPCINTRIGQVSQGNFSLDHLSPGSSDLLNSGHRVSLSRSFQSVYNAVNNQPNILCLKNPIYFICFIYSGYFYSTFSSPQLLGFAPDTARILCRSFTPKRDRQLRVKDLPKAHTLRLKRNSNPRLFER